MSYVTKCLLGAAAFAALTGTAVKADVLTPGSGWDTFFYGLQAPDPSDYFQDPSGNPEDFTFTISQPTLFRVTDGFDDGDQFNITINGVDKGPTSTPTFDGTDVGTHWGSALNNPLFSHAVYLLKAGTYTVTGIAIQSPFGAGEGAVALGAVPEPATWAMMITGFMGLGLAARRRRAALAA